MKMIMAMKKKKKKALAFVCDVGKKGLVRLDVYTEPNFTGMNVQVVERLLLFYLMSSICYCLSVSLSPVMLH